MKDCARLLVSKSNGVFNYEEAKGLVKEVDSMARKKALLGENYNTAVSKILAKRASNTKEAIIKQKANIARNFIIKKELSNKLDLLVEAGLDPLKALQAEIEGISSPIKGARDSLDAQEVAITQAFVSKFWSDLAKEDLVNIYASGKLDEQIGRALWERSHKLEPTVKNKEALRIAEIAHAAAEAQRLELNSLGADISETGGYVMPQRHNTHEMIKAGEDEWIRFMYPLLDKERSFGGEYESLGKALSGAYNAMVTGIRLNDPTVQDSKLFQFSGPANLGKKLSMSRQLHFKDFDSWKAWNERFGATSLADGIVDSLRFNARNVALMSRYGTNPQAMLETVSEELLQKHRGKIAKKGAAGSKEKAKSLVKSAMDSNSIPADISLARLGANIRAYNGLTMLGGAVISSLTDINMKALEYRFQGRTWLESYSKSVLDTRFIFKSATEQRRFLAMLGTATESLAGDIAGKFNSSDELGVKMSKIQRLYFKMNFLTQWTDGHKFAVMRTMASDLGYLKSSKFSDLPEDVARLFGNYRIEESDWDVIRASVTKLEDGREYATAETIANKEVSRKLTMYYSDRANSSVPTAGRREKRLASFDSQSGTVSGEVWRLMMQFKTYPLLMLTKGWGNAIYGRGRPDVPAMIALLLGSTLLGYVAMSVKDLLKNKTPKDPTKPETYFAAMAQGGGLGPLADLLLVDYSTGGRDPSQLLVGPTFGRASDIIKIYSASVRGEGSEAQAFRTGASFVPFGNLFYTRTALDHLILNQVQEDLSPGYLRRMEKSMKRAYGQEILFK